MIIGVAKEIKNNENRVAMAPAGVFTSFAMAIKCLFRKAQVWVQVLQTRRSGSRCDTWPYSICARTGPKAGR